MKRMVAMLAAALIGLTGCTSAGSSASARCESYPLAKAAEILNQSDVAVDRAAAVKSLEHSKAWYVAIRFHGPGIEGGEVGVWATNDINDGSIIAVDGFAQQFSSFPPNDNFSTTDKGADEVRTCV